MKRKFGFMDAVKTEFVPKKLKPKLRKYTPPSDEYIHNRVMLKGLVGVGGVAFVSIFTLPDPLQFFKEQPMVSASIAYLMIDSAAEGTEEEFNKKDVHYPLATFPVELGYLGYKGLKNLFRIGKYNKQNSF